MKSRIFSPDSSVRGVALITVLIVVAIVSATASWLMKSQFVSIQRATRIIAQEQAVIHAFGIEPLILEVLLENDSNKIDFYTDWTIRDSEGKMKPYVQDELWSKPWLISGKKHLVGFENIDSLEHVGWQICVQDLYGLVNVNRLYRLPAETTTAWFMKEALMNLFAESVPDDLELAGAPAPGPENLYDSLKDWLDEDGRPEPKGAENDYYRLNKPPYQTAAMRMAWPEEIHLVKGFQEEITSHFIHLLAALPETLTTIAGTEQLISKINLNTAPPEVLRALPGLGGENNDEGKEVVREIIEQRQLRKPFQDLDQFLAMDSIASLRKKLKETCRLEKGKDNLDCKLHQFWKDKQGPFDLLDIRSDFFLVSTQVNMGDLSRDVQLLIYRSRNDFQAYVLQRRFGDGYYSACVSAKNGSRAIRLQTS